MPEAATSRSHHVSIHQYGDDIQMYIAFQPQCLDGLSQLISMHRRRYPLVP